MVPKTHRTTDMAKLQDPLPRRTKKPEKVLGPQMKGTQYHTANVISEEVKREIQTIKMK